MSDKISIIFIGTDKIGAPLIEALVKDDRFEVKLVVTQIDRPAGRKMKLTPPPIKLKALELGIPVYQPDDVNSAESLDHFHKIHPDMVVLMAYGQILKKELLAIPEFGCVNVHASLLPKHRGASPVQQSLLHQDEMTGISIMQMVEKMDSGPVYHRFELLISDQDNALTLSEKLANLTAKKTSEVLYEIVETQLKPEPQNHNVATYCQKIHKTDGHIDWNESANLIAAKVRAFAGWPGAFTFWDGKRLKILSAKAYSYSGPESPGTVFRQGNAVLVMAKRDALLLEKIQLEGKNPQPMSEFIKGYLDFIGAKLGE